MNRKQKIIVSVVGITIVLLALLGLTYAYFLTRINGNTNTKSISVSTANLALVYGGDDGSIIGEGEVIIPGTTFDVKTFTVTNQGNATTDYVVVIEDVSVTYAETIEVDGVTQTAGNITTFQSNDFVYTLTCTSGCNGVDKETTFPINGGILVGNSIDVGETQTYAFTLTYKETGLDQSNDMNKTLNAKLNIKDISTINPYSGDTSSLAYNIINNAITGTTGTVLRSEPETKVAEEFIWGPIGTGKIIEQELNMNSQPDWYYGSTYKGAQPWNSSGSYEGVTSTCTDTIVGKYISYYSSDESWYVKSCKSSTVAIVDGEEKIYEKSLSIALDDLGTSYYYRGKVEDNYVTFADMCWRIVRIEGDGSTKLILEDQDEVCSTSMNGNWAIPTTTGGTTYGGNFGYTEHSSNTLTASDGTKNSSTRYLMNYLHGETDSASSMATAFKNFQSTFTETELSKLKAGNWCLENTTNAYDSSNNLLNSTQTMDNKIKGTRFYYDSYQRLYKNNPKQPTLKCNGTIMNDWDDAETNPTPMYVGAITDDEVAYAGGKFDTYNYNYNYYLINKEFSEHGCGGAIKADYFWLLSPCYYYGGIDSACVVSHDGILSSSDVDHNVDGVAFRPSVSLKSVSVITGGNGTKNSPYVIG